MMYSQQEIGQQIMAVRIIKEENEKECRGGKSFVQVSDIAELMKTSEDEVIELISYCKSLDLSLLLRKIAIEISNQNESFLLPYWKGLNTSMPIVVTHKLSYNDLDDIDSSLMIICINRFGLDSDWVLHSRILREGIDRCVRIYIEQINSARTTGYDWDVITEMMGEDNIFRKWMECGDREELFENIKKVFCGEDERTTDTSSR